jgi:protein TonB
MSRKSDYLYGFLTALLLHGSLVLGAVVAGKYFPGFLRPVFRPGEIGLEITLVEETAAVVPAAAATPAPEPLVAEKPVNDTEPPEPADLTDTPPDEPESEPEPVEPEPAAPDHSPEQAVQPAQLAPVRHEPAELLPVAADPPKEPVLAAPASPADLAEPASPAAARPETGVRNESLVFESEIRPHYPLGARLRGEEGVVAVRVWIEKGRAVRCEVETASGYPALDEAALTAVRHARFRSVRGSRDVNQSGVTLRFRFQLEK